MCRYIKDRVAALLKRCSSCGWLLLYFIAIELYAQQGGGSELFSVFTAQQEGILFRSPLRYPFACDTASLLQQLSKGVQIEHNAPDSAMSLYREVLQKSRQHAYAEGVVRSLTRMGCVHLNAGRTDSAILYYEASLQESRSYFYNYGVIASLIYRAMAYDSKAFPDSALFFYQEALREARLSRSVRGLIRSLEYLARAYIARNMYEEGIAAVLEEVRYVDSSKEGIKLLSDAYITLTGAYGKMGKYDECTVYLAKLTELADAYPEATDLSRVYNNMATLFGGMPEYFRESGERDELYYWNLAERVARQKRQFGVLAYVLMGKGTYYLNKHKDYRKAHQYFYATLQLADSINTPEAKEAKYQALINLGMVYNRQGAPRKALYYLQQERALNENAGFTYRNTADIRLGETYFLLQRYAEAEATLKKAYNEAKAMRMYYNIAAANVHLASLYETTNRPALALRHFQEYMHYRDSMAGAETARNLSALDVRYRTLQKDKALTEKQLLIAKQGQQLTAKNIWIIAISAGSFILVILLVTLMRSYRNHQRRLVQQQEIYQLKAMMRGEEKERSRIARELHDGIGGILSASKMNFDTLNDRFAALPADHSYSNGIRLLDEAYDQLRKTAHNLLPETLLREGLAKAVQQYCAGIGKGMSIRIGFKAFNDIPRLETEAELSLYRIIQELINNAGKHAKANHISVQMRTQDDQLFIAVEDDGVGITPEILKPDNNHTGQGLKNLEARIALLGSNLEIDSRPGIGTTIYIDLNIEQLKTVNI